MRPLYLAPGEAVVLRHALMSYRNHIAERNRDGAPYPMDDGFELLAADTLVGRLDIMSEAILMDNALRSKAPDDLGAAWREAEEALPEGWRPQFTFQRGSDERPLERVWHATIEDVDDERVGVIGSGPTPAAALRSLASVLRSSTP